METTSRTGATPATPAASAALAAARAQFGELDPSAERIAAGGETAELVLHVTGDAEVAIAAWIAQSRAAGLACGAPTVVARFGAAVERLAHQVEQLGDFGLPSDWTASRGLTAAQTETLRKMLLALAADPRLVVARLATALVRLRRARALPEAERTRLALEAREIHAPLANRLGVWSLKWELEDLAFRQLEPEEYRRIASSLAERRVAREQYLERAGAQLREALAAAGVEAEVQGRAKHIYSIWRKMQRKQLDFGELYDVRALRVIVATVADCYAALGVVHGLWRILPGEFDDYIATPKDNQYRSIHTAVVGPEERSLEIQIRTRAMHEYAELGVAAHWRYKEGGARDAIYERKIERVRQMLDPAHALEGDGDFIDSVRQELFADRVYAMTPRGEVIDLPRGATPLDFAYHVHTQLGHGCRGARVNGRIATLDQPLANGAVVEIIGGRSGGPSRDWLAPESGFLASARSRAKVRAWFHQLDSASPAAAAAPVAVTEPVPEPPIRRARPLRPRQATAVDIEGEGDMPTTMARCCAPMPPEAIAGYLTLGRGVTVHGAGCHSLQRMRALHPERVLRVSWNRGAEELMPVQIRVEAFDRRGLLRDVSDAMAQERLSIDSMSSEVDRAERVATILMRTAVRDAAQLRKVLKRLAAVSSVLRAQRSG